MAEPRVKTILITGATAGIGRHLALDLAARGHRVFATGRNAGALESLRAQSPAIETLRLDVTDPESIEEAARAVRSRTEGYGVDVLINNPGYGQAGPILELEDRVLRDQFDVNVFGLMAVTRAFVPAMVERRSGTVINLSSVAGRVTFPFFGAYHASKYAVEALSDALRMEVAPFGVRVVLVEPGPVSSSFADRSVATLPAEGARATRYGAVYARADSIRAHADRFEVGPERVAEAVRHAMTARRPRLRYLVPSLRLELMFFFLALTPARVRDWMFRSFFGLRVGEGASR